uniref:Aminotransferase-like plant mobile domain-containing protein n=1 Tax=Fagus sylvatica TaxID=28930 RepID=A0A2N9EM61_FAGSY
MTKSSSNNDPYSRAIQIIEALPTSQRLTDTLIPRGNALTSFSSTSTSPRCALAHPLMAVGTGPDDDVLNGVPLSYNEFIKHMKGAGTSPISYKEECCFYLLWICKFLACTSSIRVINYYLPIARCLANGVPVDMSSFLLGELYRAMFLLSTEPKQSHGGLALAHPNDFQQFSSQGFFKGDAAWGACLQLRDLVVIRSTNAGVEAYCPSLVARQFGLVQLLHDAAFKKAKEGVQSQAPLLILLAPSEQGTRTSTKRKSPEVEEVDLAVSPKGAKLFGKRLIKAVAKMSTAKKAKVVEVVPDFSIIEVEPLDEELDDTTTLSNLMRKVDEQKQVLSGIIEAQEAFKAEDRIIAQKFKEAKKLAAAFQAKAQVEDAERKDLEAEEEKKKQADKVEEERIAEIVRRLKIKKKEKAQADKKRQQELERKKKEGEEKKKQEEEQKKKEKKREVEAAKKKAEQVVQPAIKVRTSIEAATSSIEAATPWLAPHMLEGLGDIDKLFEDVSLTLQQCQTPTKTSSTSISLEPSRDQLQAVISQLKELLQKPVGLVLLDANLVDQFQQVTRFLTTHSSILSEGGRALLGLFVQNLESTTSKLQAAQEKRNRATSQEVDHKQRVSKLQAHQLDLQTKASELKSIDQKVKSLEFELKLWKSKCTQKCLELQTVHAEAKGWFEG